MSGFAIGCIIFAALIAVAVLKADDIVAFVRKQMRS